MRPRLLYLYLAPSSFVRDDLALLAAHYDVRSFHFDARQARSKRGLLRLLRAQRAWLRRELPQADLLYGWFADYHLLLPVWMARRAGVPVAVAIGGFDASVVPSLDYGVYRSRWRAPLARYVVRRATHLLPVAEALLETENRYAEWPHALRNGLRVHVPGALPPATVIPTGYDAPEWPEGDATRAPSVLSVALVDQPRTWKLKGLDVLAEAARRLPEVPFTVVGVADEVAVALRETLPPNVALLPPAPREALAAHYRQASVYAHLSRSEGFPNAVCEAMLCGAVPVVSPVGAMPEIVGAAGFVVETPEPDAIAATIRQALGAPAALRVAARERIATRFTRAEREARLLAVLGEIAEASTGEPR